MRSFFLLHLIREKAPSPEVVISIPTSLCARNTSLVQILPKPLRKGLFLWPQKGPRRESRTLWLVSKLIAFLSSLLQRSYHRISNQKTNLPRNFSHTQGKYIGSYTLSATQPPVHGLWILPVSVRAVISSRHVVSCDYTFSN